MPNLRGREVPANMLLSAHARLRRAVVRNKLRVIYRKVRECLTDNQRDIIKLALRGYTQSEIGERLSIHQTSVHKALYGNLVYSGEYTGARYGGILTKLYKRCRREPELLSEWQEFERLFGFSWSGMIQSF